MGNKIHKFFLVEVNRLFHLHDLFWPIEPSIKVDILLVVPGKIPAPRGCRRTFTGAFLSLFSILVQLVMGIHKQDKPLGGPFLQPVAGV